MRRIALWPSGFLRKYQFELFAALGLAVVTGLFSGVNRGSWRGASLHLWAYELQAGLLVCLLAGVVHYFWPRRGLYWDLFLTNPLIGLAIPGLVGLSFGKLMPELGFYYLFWSGPPWHALVSSAAVLLTIAVHWLLLYFLYIDSYDVSLDTAAGEGPGLGRFEQSQRHARRLWREFGFERELTGNQPGWFVYESTKPFAVLLAIPALLPRFSIVRSVGTGSGMGSAQLGISAGWLGGVALGLMGVAAGRTWIGAATRLDWALRDRRSPGRQEGVADLLDLGVVFAVLVPVFAGLTVAYNASRWHPGVSMTLTVVTVAALAARAYHLRRTASAVSNLARALFADYLFVLIGILCFFAGVSLAVRLSGEGFVSTICLCYLLIAGSSVIALLTWLFTSQSYARQMTTVGVLVLMLLVNGINPYKLQYDGLAGYYPDRLLGASRSTSGLRSLSAYQKEEDRRLDGRGRDPVGPLIDDDEVLRLWAARWREAHPGSAGKPKLTVVACSGGALRAAIWTALVLGKVEEKVEDFPQSLRLITGASGGMLGAALYVAGLEPPGGEDADAPLRSSIKGEPFARQLYHDFLTKPIQHLVFGDTLVFPHPFAQTLDRGKVLEQGWQSRLKRLDRGITFHALIEQERRGARPSLVFTPMIVEDSRRLFISNLELGRFTVNHGRFDPLSRGKQYKPEGPTAADRDLVFPAYSRVGYQFFRLFPQAHGLFPVSAAVRMSATFPVISPTVNLPTEPSLRVVDAGYYDNYGVDLATSWLEEHREWLARNTSGVALIQIRAFTNEEKLRNYPSPEPPGTASERLIGSLGGWLDRGGQFLTSPLTGVANARGLVMSYRNDNEVESLKRLFTFDRLEALTGLVGDPDPSRLDPEVRWRLQDRYEEARDFFRVFTFTCGKISQPGGDGPTPGAPGPIAPAGAGTPARRAQGPADPSTDRGLPEIETMNWFVTEAEYGLFTREIWRNNQDRFDALVGWLRKPDASP